MKLAHHDMVRIVAGLTRGELLRLRPHSALLPPLRTWDAQTALHDNGLALGSLELASVVEAIGRFFDLRDTNWEDLLRRETTLGDWADFVLRAWQEPRERLSFTTSGSTGEPRVVSHTTGSLQNEARTLAALIGPVHRVVALTPAHHLYGFMFGILLPHVLQVPVVTQGPWLCGDLVVATPNVWEQLQTPQPSGIRGVSSGGPLQPLGWERAKAAGIDLLDIYGSTETAGVGISDGPGRPFRLLPHLAAVPSMVPDQLHWVSDREFYVLRRLDGAVSISGVNVYPHRVRQVITAHPLVADAAVRLMRPDEGSRFKAFVVLHPAVQATPGVNIEIEAQLRRQLTAIEMPASIVYGPQLPRSAEGKLIDWSIACMD